MNLWKFILCSVGLSICHHTEVEITYKYISVHYIYIYICKCVHYINKSLLYVQTISSWNRTTNFTHFMWVSWAWRIPLVTCLHFHRSFCSAWPASSWWTRRGTPRSPTGTWVLWCFVNVCFVQVTILKLVWCSQRASVRALSYWYLFCDPRRWANSKKMRRTEARQRVRSATPCHLDETNMDLTTVHH